MIVQRWEFAPVSTYWNEAFDGRSPLETYYTEGRQALEAKIAIFNQAIHAVRAITFRLRHGYFPRLGVRAYLPEAIDML